MKSSSSSDWLFPEAAGASASTPPARTSGQCICFDIEIADEFELAPGEDLDSRGPFDISVVAASDELGEVRHWLKRDEHGRPQRHIDAAIAREALLHLRDAQRRGARVFAWNGLAFDLRWLGVAANDLPLAAEVALELYDPMLQFVGRRGFPISLASAAEGLGITEKKLMSGADAPKEWARGNHQKVLDYVAGDCRLTGQIVAQIEATRSIRWRTKKGTLSSEPIPALRRVREIMRDPPPDQSWMSDPKPWDSWFQWITPFAKLAAP